MAAPALAQTPELVTLDLFPDSFKFTKTANTNKIDNGFSSAEVSTKNCDVGKCNSSNSWNVGLNSKASKSVEAVMTLNFRLQGIDLDISRVKNMMFSLGGCWHGGGGEACANKSNPDFTSAGGKAAIRIWNANASPWKWEQIGTMIALGSGASSVADKYAQYSKSKTSNFNSGHVADGIVSISIRTFGTTVSNFNVIQVIDYAKLSIVYEKPGPVNSPPASSAGNDQIVDAGTTVMLDASGSSDSEGDLLSYSWTQTSGPPIVIENSDESVASFLAPGVDRSTSLTFEVTVSDAQSSSSDSVRVTVRGTSSTSTKPNVVLIFTDDQRWDTLEYMPAVENRIAGEGALFTNAFVTVPLCCPSRASLLTGQYAHNHNLWTNEPATGGGAANFEDGSTLATWLKAKGYKTSIIGKYFNYYWNMHPYIPPGWDDWHVIQNVNYFDFMMSENGEEKKYTGSQNYMTDVLKEKAVQFIRDNWDDPFFLYLPLPAPHVDVTVSPFNAIPAPRHAGSCDSIPNWRPPSYNEADWSDKPALLSYIKPMDLADQSYVDKLRRNQICTLKSTDELVAALLDELGTKLDNTLVIYTSDNGFFWGEHRLDGKNQMYDEAVRVPLAIRYPPLIPTPQVRNDLVSMVDIPATISEIAGAPPTPEIELNGNSLIRLFSGDRWPKHVFMELKKFEGISAVRSEEFKLVEYRTVSGPVYEFYDLKSDPYELENRASDPDFEAIRAQMLMTMEDFKNDRCVDICGDTTPPETVIDSFFDGNGNPLPIVSGQVVNTPIVSIGFSGTDNVAVAGFECTVDSLSESSFSSCSSPHVFDSLAEGQHLLVVRAFDAAGNRDPLPAELAIHVSLPDTTPPDTSIDLLFDGQGNELAAIDGQILTTDSLSYGFSGTDDESVSEFECSIDSIADESFSVCTSPHAFAGLSEGEHVLVVRAIDATGNKDPSPAELDIVIDFDTTS